MTLARAVARKVYGLDSVTSRAYGVKTLAVAVASGPADTVRSWVWPGSGRRLETEQVGASPFAARKLRALAVGTNRRT